MTMAVLTAQGISRVAIELLVRKLTLPRTVTMVPGEEFSGSNGDTITLRVPLASASRTQASRGAALTADDVSEVGIDVAMSHLYHLKNLSDQEIEFDLENFARQITVPQTNAVALGVEATLTTVMNALAADDGVGTFALSASESDTIAQILAMREELGTKEVPPDNRYLAVSPEIATRLLSTSQFVKANESGSTEALREATIGRIFGFTVVECNGLTAGTAIAYHRSGFALAVRPPKAPRGASSSSSASAQGIGMRQVFQYDASTAQDQSLLSTFAGAAAVWEDGATATDSRRWVKFDTSAV
jgi:hypothetical protein